MVQSRPMLSSVRLRIVPLCWLFIPSLLWTLSLQSIAFCVDPLLLPVIEERLPSAWARVVRWVWVSVYAVTLLTVWNIGPGTYSFYIHEALPYAPKTVLVMLVAAIILMIWFGLQKNVVAALNSEKNYLFIVGVVLMLLKGMVAMDIVNLTAARQYVRSPVLGNLHRYFIPHNSYLTSAKETPESTFYSFIQHEKNLAPQVVLMVVESWGEKVDTLSLIADDIAGQGFEIIKSGFSTYRGSTLSGEFRELCSKYVQPSDGLADAMKTFECAPRYLHAKGYYIAGFHGYKKIFYARATFWERFGLQNQTFGDELQSQPQCPGPFPGVCDENLIQDGIGALDAAKKPTFVYMLTLSSHEPVDPSALDRHGAHFNEIPVAHPTQIITRRAISSLVDDLKNRSSHACTWVYVVGDHQPPSASAKGGIFEAGKVPYLVFSQNCPASSPL